MRYDLYDTFTTVNSLSSKLKSVLPSCLRFSVTEISTLFSRGHVDLLQIETLNECVKGIVCVHNWMKREKRPFSTSTIGDDLLIQCF